MQVLRFLLGFVSGIVSKAAMIMTLKKAVINNAGRMLRKQYNDHDCKGLLRMIDNKILKYI